MWRFVRNKRKFVNSLGNLGCGISILALSPCMVSSALDKRQTEGIPDEPPKIKSDDVLESSISRQACTSEVGMGFAVFSTQGTRNLSCRCSVPCILLRHVYCHLERP
jgi:hypothetical protein